MNEIDVSVRQSATKKLQSADALKILDSVDRIYVAKGKNLSYFDLQKDKPDPESLLKKLLGPTGNLRAPTVRVGRTLLVGFNHDQYQSVFEK